jgi:hypothetical protein
VRDAAALGERGASRGSNRSTRATAACRRSSSSPRDAARSPSRSSRASGRCRSRSDRRSSPSTTSGGTSANTVYLLTDTLRAGGRPRTDRRARRHLALDVRVEGGAYVTRIASTASPRPAAASSMLPSWRRGRPGVYSTVEPAASRGNHLDATTSTEETCRPRRPARLPWVRHPVHDLRADESPGASRRPGSSCPRPRLALLEGPALQRSADWGCVPGSSSEGAAQPATSGRATSCRSARACRTRRPSLRARWGEACRAGAGSRARSPGRGISAHQRADGQTILGTGGFVEQRCRRRPDPAGPSVSGTARR